MNSITAINIVRDNLRSNLPDPYIYAGASSRDGSTWIYADEPRVASRYPQLEIKKVDNPSTNISIGNPAVREYLYLNLWFYAKNGFKCTINSTEYKNAALVEYYLGLIKSTFKGQFDTYQSSGLIGPSYLNTTTVGYEPETQLYFGAVTVRVEYFTTVC